jgi:hypothetical protein
VEHIRTHACGRGGVVAAPASTNSIVTAASANASVNVNGDDNSIHDSFVVVVGDDDWGVLCGDAAACS